MESFFTESIINFLTPLAHRLGISTPMLRRMPAAAKEAYDNILERLGVEDTVVAQRNIYFI